MKNPIFLYSIVSILTSVGANSAGSECDKDDDCFNDLSCEYSQCDCRPGFVQNGTQCYPVAAHMEKCLFSEQCLDHRQICVEVSQELRCVCDEYYDFDNTTVECVVKENIMATLTNNDEAISAMRAVENNIFSVILVLGYCVALICLAGFVIALIYCYKMNRSDKRMDKELKVYIAKTEKENKNKKKPRAKTPPSDEEAIEPYTDASMTPNIITMDMVLA